jgi:hypothetical protein
MLAAPMRLVRTFREQLCCEPPRLSSSGCAPSISLLPSGGEERVDRGLSVQRCVSDGTGVAPTRSAADPAEGSGFAESLRRRLRGSPGTSRLRASACSPAASTMESRVCTRSPLRSRALWAERSLLSNGIVPPGWGAPDLPGRSSGVSPASTSTLLARCVGGCHVLAGRAWVVPSRALPGFIAAS